MINIKYGFLFLGALSISVHGAGKEVFSDTVLEELCKDADNLAAILNQYTIASVNVQSVEKKEDYSSFYDTHILPLIALASKQETENVITRNLINRFNQYLEKKEVTLLINISEYFHKEINHQPQFDMIKHAFNRFLSVDVPLENIVAEQRNIPSLPVKNLPLPEVHIDSVFSNSNVRLYLCRYSCGHKAEHKGNVRRHEKTCSKRPADAPEVFKYLCQYNCGYSTVRDSNVTRHEQRCKLRPADAPEVFKHPCQYSCGYGALLRYTVVEHEKICSKRPVDAPEVFKHPCQYGCGYGSVYKNDIVRHEKICSKRPADAPEVFKHLCQYNCGYMSVKKSSVTRHEKRCKLRPGGPQVIGFKRKSNDDKADPRKRQAL